ncbi:Gfo/Idh/MocA family oxidoreductase [Candidatus Poribacteria bacterium]|nr:Gfo/Idh/MocA family oxidoreductase [Candidatus Poribacteria bacterium]
MTIVRIGLAGCGSVSQRGLLPHLAQEDIRQWCELFAVMDPVPGRARATAEKFGVPLSFEDYDEMLASEVDAVVIASPIGLHYEQAMQAIAAGKHVHVNKTMTTTTAEADEVISAAQKAGVKVVASPGRAHQPSIRRIREIIAAGEIGRVYWAEIGASSSGHEFEGFRQADDILSNVNPAWYYKRPGGGPMYDMAVYALHTITGILGPVKRVAGMSGIGLKERMFKNQKIEVEMDDNTHLLLDFGDNVFCLLFSSNSYDGPGHSFSVPFISGSEGGITTSREGLEIWGRNVEGWRRVEVPGSDMPFIFGQHLELPERHVYSDIMHLVDCVLCDKEPAISAEHARHVIEIIELGYKAAETGQAQNMTTTFSPRELTVGLY